MGGWERERGRREEIFAGTQRQCTHAVERVYKGQMDGWDGTQKEIKGPIMQETHYYLAGKDCFWAIIIIAIPFIHSFTCQMFADSQLWPSWSIYASMLDRRTLSSTLLAMVQKNARQSGGQQQVNSEEIALVSLLCFDPFFPVCHGLSIASIHCQMHYLDTPPTKYFDATWTNVQVHSSHPSRVSVSTHTK